MTKPTSVKLYTPPLPSRSTERISPPVTEEKRTYVSSVVRKGLIKSDKKAGNPFKDGKYSQICVEAGARVIELSKKVNMPGNIEDYGLREFHDFVKEHGKKVPQEKIDRINRVSQ